MQVPWHQESHVRIKWDLQQSTVICFIRTVRKSYWANDQRGKCRGTHITPGKWLIMVKPALNVANRTSEHWCVEAIPLFFQSERQPQDGALVQPSTTDPNQGEEPEVVGINRPSVITSQSRERRPTPWSRLKAIVIQSQMVRKILIRTQNFMWQKFHNIKVKPKNSKVRTLKIYTDTDTEGITEVTRDLQIKLHSKGYTWSGSQGRLGSRNECVIPVVFQADIPQKLDAEGFPKKAALQPIKVELQLHTDGVLRGFGTTIIQVVHYETLMLHPIRFHTVQTKNEAIVGHAVCYLQGLLEINNKQ